MDCKKALIYIVYSRLLISRIPPLNESARVGVKEKTMKKVPFSLVVVLVLSFLPSQAQIRLGENTSVVFATVEEGQKILMQRDDFVERLSPFDRAARMKTDEAVSEEEFLKFVGVNVLRWDDQDKQKVITAFQKIKPSLDSLSLPFPNEVFVIKTTGNEEGGAAYTRANAIVLTKSVLNAPLATIQKLICHELFHIMSRANPDLREQLYETIGFVKCKELTFPSELKSRKITNPDAPRNDHCIRLEVNGKTYWSLPILFSNSEKYDVEQGGEFFNYLQFQFLLVEWNEGSSVVTPIYDGGKPKRFGIQQVSGFFEQVGRNTGYIIHPEEILADNFALLVLGERNLPSPEVVGKIENILKEGSPNQSMDKDKK